MCALLQPPSLLGHQPARKTPASSWDASPQAVGSGKALFLALCWWGWRRWGGNTLNPKPIQGWSHEFRCNDRLTSAAQKPPVV